ncbi:MAG TPA: hypothetical protein VGB19_16505 [Actinomycetota bacterium]
MSAPELDRVHVLVAVTEALTAHVLAGSDLDAIPEDRTGLGSVVCASGGGILCGLPVARETFARLGVRLRPLSGEGGPVQAGDRVAELGGPIRAMRAAQPVALGFLERLSAVASGLREADPGAPFDAYASGFVSPELPVRDNGPRFELQEG